MSSVADSPTVLRTPVAIVGGSTGSLVARGLADAGTDSVLLAPGSAGGTLPSRVTHLGGASVFAGSADRLEVEVGGEPLVVHCDHLVLAPDARSRPVAFDGWHLDGVITVDDLRREKGAPVFGSGRAIVVGRSPDLERAAASLAAAGTDVVECVDMAEGAMALAALGERHVERVRIGGFDAADGVARDLDVDMVCTAFGPMPATELAQLLGCTLDHDPQRGGWYAPHAAGMATDVRGVRVAGAITGAFDEASATAQAEAVVRAVVGAADEQSTPAPAPPPLSDSVLACLLTDDIVACPCEGVAVGDVVSAAALCGDEPRAVKLATRAGMGRCQGRRCAPVIADVLRVRRGVRGPIPPPRVQVPIQPVRTAILLATSGERP